jgi:hypothetical protein
MLTNLDDDMRIDGWRISPPASHPSWMISVPSVRKPLIIDRAGGVHVYDIEQYMIDGMGVCGASMSDTAATRSRTR